MCLLLSRELSTGSSVLLHTMHVEANETIIWGSVLAYYQASVVPCPGDKGARSKVE